MRARDHVPEVAIDGVDEEKFAVFIPIMPPRIGGAMGEDFDDLALRVVAPNAAIHRDSIRFWSSWHSEFPRAGMPTAPVEPTIGAPF